MGKGKKKKIVKKAVALKEFAQPGPFSAESDNDSRRSAIKDGFVGAGHAGRKTVNNPENDFVLGSLSSLVAEKHVSPQEGFKSVVDSPKDIMNKILEDARSITKSHLSKADIPSPLLKSESAVFPLFDPQEASDQNEQADTHKETKRTDENQNTLVTKNYSTGTIIAAENDQVVDPKTFAKIDEMDSPHFDNNSEGAFVPADLDIVSTTETCRATEDEGSNRYLESKKAKSSQRSKLKPSRSTSVPSTGKAILSQSVFKLKPSNNLGLKSHLNISPEVSHLRSKAASGANVDKEEDQYEEGKEQCILREGTAVVSDQSSIMLQNEIVSAMAVLTSASVGLENSDDGNMNSGNRKPSIPSRKQSQSDTETDVVRNAKSSNSIEMFLEESSIHDVTSYSSTHVLREQQKQRDSGGSSNVPDCTQRKGSFGNSAFHPPEPKAGCGKASHGTCPSSSSNISWNAEERATNESEQSTSEVHDIIKPNNLQQDSKKVAGSLRPRTSKSGTHLSPSPKKSEIRKVRRTSSESSFTSAPDTDKHRGDVPSVPPKLEDAHVRVSRHSDRNRRVNQSSHKKDEQTNEQNPKGTYKKALPKSKEIIARICVGTKERHSGRGKKLPFVSRKNIRPEADSGVPGSPDSSVECSRDRYKMKGISNKARNSGIGNYDAEDQNGDSSVRRVVEIVSDVVAEAILFEGLEKARRAIEK